MILPEGLPCAVCLGQVYMVSVVLFAVCLVSGQLNKEESGHYLISDWNSEKSFQNLSTHCYLFSLGNKWTPRTFGGKKTVIEICVICMSISVYLVYYCQSKSNLLKLILFSKIHVQQYKRYIHSSVLMELNLETNS